MVAWANGADVGSGDLDDWTVSEPDGDVYQPGAADFSQYWRADPGQGGTLRFSGPGENALALYELSDERPPGVTVEGLTFRERVAGDRLVAADAVRGEGSLTMSVQVPEGVLSFGAVCRIEPGVGAPETISLEVLVDGEMMVSGTGCDRPDALFDPGAHQFASWPDGIRTSAGQVRPGETVEVTARFVDDAGDPVPVGDEALLAAGLYEQGDPLPFMAAGQPVPRLVEVDGVTWTFDRVARSEPGGPLVTTLPDEPAVISYHFSGVPDGHLVRLLVDGKPEGTQFMGEDGAMPSGFLPSGGEVSLEVEGGPGPRTRLAILRYTRQQ
ncbi:hypothetical protein [Nocardioides houyundeii]|uniref:hypothetical protein n=1 Tax=Nocardioides houyundeii TaxID=2045452 RepID=UPI000C7787E6|nr:hypothetical protein [Nocardioides houyundeii]